MEAAPSTLNQEEVKEEAGNERKEPQPVVVRREPARELVSWSAKSRPFKSRDRQFFVTVFAIAGIVGLVLFLAEGFMPVLLIAALVFLYYVLSTVPPENIEYKITTKGVKIADRLTEWNLLKSFSFQKKLEQEILVFETFMMPGRLELVIDPAVKERLEKEISDYIPKEEIRATGLDRFTNWVAKKLPGNN